MQIWPYLARGLYVYMRDQYGNADAFLSEAQLSLAELEQASGFIEQATMQRVVLSAYRLSRDPALGLRIGMALQPATFGTFGHLFMQCATLRSAISEVQRYAPLMMSSGSFGLREEGSLAYLSFHTPGLSHGALFASEVCLSLLLGVGRHYAGLRERPRLARFPYPMPAHVASYEAVFACDLDFDAECAELAFDRELLDRVQPFSNVALRRVLKEQAESLLLSERPSEPLHVRVRAILKEEHLTLGEHGRKLLARRLGLSPRSLRRRLAQEGTTLWSLLENARKEHAFRLLRETDMPLKNIAERLGFSEPSAFHRAFKRWTGQTPIHFRSFGHGPASLAS